MNLETLSTGELVVQYNAAAAILGEAPVKRFADKAVAVRRTTTITLRLPTKKTRKPRGMRFVFKPESEIRVCKGTAKTKSEDKRTLRQRAVDMLLRGATFAQLETLVEAFDKDRGVERGNIERRSYELVRLVHYYLGYGLRQDEHGRIFAYTDPAETA